MPIWKNVQDALSEKSKLQKRIYILDANNRGERYTRMHTDHIYACTHARTYTRTCMRAYVPEEGYDKLLTAVTFKKGELGIFTFYSTLSCTVVRLYIYVFFNDNY